MAKRNLMLSLALMVLCGAVWAQENPPASPPAQAEAGRQADLVVVRVSGDPITEKQVMGQINVLANQTILTPDERKQRNTFLFQGAIDNLITASLLKEYARKQNVVIDKAKVDEQVQKLVSQYPSPEAFQKALSSQGGSEAELRRMIEESLMMQRVLDDVAKNVPPPAEEEIVKFYNDNPDKFALPERVHAAHILLKVDKNATAEQKAEIKKKLEDIRAEIESKKISFSDAATKYSQDASNAQQGGDLGFFSRGQMVVPFEQAAFGMTPGTLSTVIETQFGYHIIQLIEHQPAHKASLEEARPAIKEHLEKVARQQAAKKLVEELKANAQIETFMTAEEFGRRHPEK